jgi:MFS family permease
MVGISMGTLFALSVFLEPLQAEFGWSRASLSFAAFLNWILFAAGAWGWGFLTDRVGIRVVTALAGTLAGLGCVLSGQARTLMHLYLGFGIVAGLGIGGFYPPLSSTATRWFTRHRGLAVGLVSAGNGAGILLVAPLARWLINAYGWRAAFTALGLLNWAIIWPLSIVVRTSPREQGLLPYGEPRKPHSESRDSPTPPPPTPDPGSPGRTSVFWSVAVTHFLCCLAHSGPIFHMVAAAIDQGIPKLAAAGALGLSGGASGIGRIGSGVLADRFGARRTLIGCLAFQAIAILLYVWASNLAAFNLLAVAFGAAYGAVMPLYAVVSREQFGERVIGTTYGAIFMISAVGMGLGSQLGGWVFDWTGRYLALYLASAILGASAIPLAAAFPAPRRPRPPLTLPSPPRGRVGERGAFMIPGRRRRRHDARGGRAPSSRIE